jgi:hypothetical protein
MRKLSLLTLGLLTTFGVFANRVTVSNQADLTAKLTSSVTGDTLILATGTYTAFKFPSGKAITVMALDTATAKFNGQFGHVSPAAAGTAISFENVQFNGGGSTSSGKYFISENFTGTYDSIVFKKCDFQGYTRCLFNWNSANPNQSQLTKLLIKNCLLNNFGAANYNMIWTSTPILEITMIDNTIYNSMVGSKPETLFTPKTNPTNAVSCKFTFKHNTYYTGSRTDKAAFAYPIFNFQSFYAGQESTIDISDNIVICPSTGFMANNFMTIKAGYWSGSMNNNLFVGHKGIVTPIMTTVDGVTTDITETIVGLTKDKNYPTLDTLGISSITDVFADASSSNFGIYTKYSKLVGLSSTGGVIGASRWVNNTNDLAKLTVGLAPNVNTAAGTINGPKGIVELNKDVTLTAVKNFGYKFTKWVDQTGATLSDTVAYTFKATGDKTVYAVFDSVKIYKLAVNVVGGGGEYSVSATGKDGGYVYYEEGTELTLTANNAPIFSFLAWYDNYTTGEGYAASNPLVIKMDKDVTKYLEFATEPFLCGWKCNFNTNAQPATYVGTNMTATPVLSMYYTYQDKTAHTPFSQWWGGKDAPNSITPWKYYTNTGAMTNDTTPTRLKGEAYYLETMLNTKNYHDFCLTYQLKTSYYGYDSLLIQIKYKEEGSWETVAKHGVGASYALFKDTIVNSGGKETLYLRMMPDITSAPHNNIKDVDGTSYREIFILGLSTVSVAGVKSEAPEVIVSNGWVQVRNKSGVQDMTVFAMDGRVVYKGQVNGLSNFRLDRSGLYLLKVGNSITKFKY